MPQSKRLEQKTKMLEDFSIPSCNEHFFVVGMRWPVPGKQGSQAVKNYVYEAKTQIKAWRCMFSKHSEGTMLQL